MSCIVYLYFFITTKQTVYTYPGRFDAEISIDWERYQDTDERKRLAEHAERLINVQDELYSKDVQSLICITKNALPTIPFLGLRCLSLRTAYCFIFEYPKNKMKSASL